MVCLDSNIWVYYFDTTLPEHPSVADAVDSVRIEQSLFVPTVVQMELIHYLSNQVIDGDDLADRFLAATGPTVAQLTRADVRRATDILQEHPHTSLGGRDAPILATMERCGVDTLWTHDRGFAHVAAARGLTVVDPVET